MKYFFAILFLILAFVLGISTGLGIFAYGIYMIVLMVKGTLAVSFFGIVKIILCWFGAGLGGWLVGMFFMGLAALCGLKR